MALAADPSLVLLFLGLPPAAEAEGRDRTSIELPANHVGLVARSLGCQPARGRRPEQWIAGHYGELRGAAGAKVEFWLTGQAHGDTIVDVLLGDVNPCGKRTETVPVRLGDTPSYLNFPGENGHVRYGEGIYRSRMDLHRRREEVFAGSSSRDLRLRAVIEVPGHAYELPPPSGHHSVNGWPIQPLSRRTPTHRRTRRLSEAEWATCSVTRWAVTPSSGIRCSH